MDKINQLKTEIYDLMEAQAVLQARFNELEKLKTQKMGELNEARKLQAGQTTMPAEQRDS